MFTDMVGYSALAQLDEPLALQLLEEHRAIARPLFTQFGGREIKTIGDAFLVEFSSALAAVACAIEVQRTFHERNCDVPLERRIRLRIGLHAGDVIIKENDVLGDGVNIASRIEPLAEPGGICLSEDVARQVQNKLEVSVAKLGSGELKNIRLPVALYRLILPWETAGSDFARRWKFRLARKSARRITLASAFALVAAVTALFLWRRERASTEAAPVNRIAVLPLVNFSAEPRDEYFADGVTEELISSLAMLRELNVIARTSVAQFKGTRLGIPQIGAALHVGSILEGSVRVVGEEARINLNLVDVRSQKTLWTQEFTRKLKDVFAVQSEIAANVTAALKVQLLAGERSRLERRGTDNSDAYREYLLGRTQLNKRTGEEVMKAVASFGRAVELDPSFALAYAGLAEGYTLAGGAGYGSLPREQAIARARAFAQKAIALDESLAEAHAALAYMKFRIDWDWAGAEADFKRALELKPGYARAHEWYALYLAIQRRLPAALGEMQLAWRLDPLSPSVSTGVGRILHFQRRFDEAVRQFEKTLALDPAYAEAYFSLGITYGQMGRHDDAIKALESAIRLSGRRQVMVAMLGFTYGLAGRHEEARRIRDELAAQARTTHVSPYHFGLIAFGLGDVEATMDYFSRALEEKEGILIYLPVDPLSEKLWSHPRYGGLLEKMNLAR